MQYIKRVFSEQTGGNCFVDFIELSDGRILGIDDSCVVLYKNLDEFYEATPENKQTIILEDN